MPDIVIVLNEGPPWGFRMTGGKNAGTPLKISRVILYFDFFIRKLHKLLCITVIFSFNLFDKFKFII